MNSSVRLNYLLSGKAIGRTDFISTKISNLSCAIHQQEISGSVLFVAKIDGH